MKKILLAIALMFLFTVASFAQSTTVSGQVTDTDPQAWNNGTFVFTFVTNPNYPIFGNYSWTGGTLPFTVSGSMNATGAYSVSVPSNSAITPINSQWSLKVCPQGSGSCVTIANTTITGATQTLNVTPSAIRINLSTATPPVSAYADAEIVGAVIGSQYYSLTLAGNRVCQAVTGNTCTTWGAAGGVSPNSPVPGNQAQGPQFNWQNYGAKGDTQHIIDGVTAGGGGHTVTSVSAPFLAADVGKKIVCVAGGNATPLMPISTITVFNSTSSVTTNGTDAGAASNLKCLWYTKDDTASILAANNAAAPAIASIDPNVGKTLGTPAGTGYCPPGGYAVSGRIFSMAGTGNSVGPSLKGDPGKNHCIIYPLPGMVDPNDGFPVLISNYNTVGFDMEDITIDGDGFAGFNFGHPVVGVLSSQQFTVKRLKITNLSSNGASVGTLEFNASANGSTEDIFIQGGGGTGTDYACSFRNGTSEILNRRLTCSNHNQNLLVDGNGATPRSVFGDNGITCIGCLIDECDGGTVNCAVISNGGLLNVHDSTFMQGSSAANYALQVDGTSRAYLTNVSCGVFGSIATTSNCMTIASGGEVGATMSDLRGNGASGVAVNGPSTAKFYDLGYNKYRNSNNGVITDLTAANMFTNGFTGGVFPVFPLAIAATTQLGMRQFVQGTAPTFAVTGFGTGPTVTVGTGSTDAAGSVLITAGTTPGSSGTFTLTFSTVAGAYGTNPPACVFGLQNGTGSWGNQSQAPAVTSPLTTSVAASWNNFVSGTATALTAASTYGFTWSCYGK